jgi:hypothetical protein
MNIKEIKDRIALEELVDRVSVLGDRKDFNAQVQLPKFRATAAHGYSLTGQFLSG